VSDRQSVIPVLLLGLCAGAAPAAAAPAKPPRMSVIEGKDVSGTIYKKLGLPNRQYCWEACLEEERCSGVRWGVVAGDTAGLCLLLTGPLSFKDLVEPRTEDGKPIHVTAARKDVDTTGGT
jgi:hypothetical protein